MAEFGELLPRVRVPPPGPASRALSERLARVESRNVTYRGPDFPVFWEEARGANVRDADGNVYLVRTAAFGVSLLGHGAEPVRNSVVAQARRLVHGMGDVHPPSVKVEFLEALVRAVEGGWGPAGSGEPVAFPLRGARAVLANSGSEAVEIALKTAHLATGKTGVVAFRGGYHGLTLGALSVTERPYFRERFAERLPGDVAWLDYPVTGDPVAGVLEELEALLERGIPDGAGRTPAGAVILEPVQARGGVRVPAEGFCAALSALGREHGAVVIADEIYTGFGRCGAVLASSRVGLAPDLVCVGKVLGGGLPVSACVGSAAVMDAWPESPGEALHTSTFLGHPLGCAAGLAVLREVGTGLSERCEVLGVRLLRRLREALDDIPAVRSIRGLGLLLGVELAPGEAVAVAEAALKRGLILLPAGDQGEVVELSPPVTLNEAQEAAAVEILSAAIREVAG